MIAPIAECARGPGRARMRVWIRWRQTCCNGWRSSQGSRSVPTRGHFTLPAAAALLAGPVRAQTTYPSRPIRMLVGYPAGGGVDLVARLIGEPMKAALNGTVIVENRPGASAMIA